MKRVHKKDPDTWSARIEKKVRLTLEKPPENPLDDALRDACRRGPNGEYSHQPLLIKGYDWKENPHVDSLIYWPANEEIGRAVVNLIDADLWSFERGCEFDMAFNCGNEDDNVADALYALADEQERTDSTEVYLPGLYYQLCRTFDVDALSCLGTIRKLTLDPVPEKYQHSRVHCKDLHARLYTVNASISSYDA